MLSSLQNDVFIFSGLKTHAQLLEASKQLLTDDGKIKPYKLFANDIQALNDNYNQNYLEAEYQFAITSSQMAGKWAGISSDYDLQYRTASDDRVRDTHRVLHDITLPANDAFWLLYYPPNGWRCRCTALEVRKGKYKITDSAAAISAGEKATTQEGKDGKNRLELFRFNPGAKGVVFPPEHPYGKVKGAKKVKQILEKELPPEPEHTPKEIITYEQSLNIKIDREIFSYLKKDTPLQCPVVKDGQTAAGAYYHPAENFVRVPLDSRRRGSKWYSQAVVYHEFGHAADWQNGFKNMDSVTGLMEKYRKTYAKDKQAGYIDLHKKLIKQHSDAIISKDKDRLEKVGAVGDTLMSLNPKYGFGHSKKYFALSGNKEAEFLAHVFENKFIGNEIFKELMPELYDDMISLADELKTKVK